MFFFFFFVHVRALLLPLSLLLALPALKVRGGDDRGHAGLGVWHAAQLAARAPDGRHHLPPGRLCRPAAGRLSVSWKKWFKYTMKMTILYYEK